MGGWGPVIASAVVQLLGMGIMFGTHNRAIKDHDKRLEEQGGKIDRHGEEIGDIAVDVGRLKLVTKINGH